MARNITIALSDDLARRLRVRAAEEDMSVSRYLGALAERELSPEPAPASAPGQASAAHPGKELPGYWEAFERWKKVGGESAPGPR